MCPHIYKQLIYGNVDLSYQNNLPEKRNLKEVKLQGGNELYILENVAVSEAHDFFNGLNLENITAFEFARARIESDLSCKYGTFVAESYVHLLNGDMLVVAKKHSPFLKQTNAMPFCHKKGEELLIYAEHAFELITLAEKNVEKAIERGVLYVPRNNIKNVILPNDFGNYAVTRFLFGEFAKKTGLLLQSHGFTSVIHRTPSLDYIQQQSMPFCRPLWIHPVCKKSDMCAYPDIVSKTTMIGYKANKGKERRLRTSAVTNKDLLPDLEIPPDIYLDNSPKSHIDLDDSPKPPIVVEEYNPKYPRKKNKRRHQFDKGKYINWI